MSYRSMMGLPSSNDKPSDATSSIYEGSIIDTAIPHYESAPKTVKSHRPSLSTSSLSTYNTKCITKHYALNHQILDAFDSLFERQMFRGAYAFGIQFVEVALLEIPKHGYFYAPKHKPARLLNNKNALRVTQQLETILRDTMPSSMAKPCDWERVTKLRTLAEESNNSTAVAEQQQMQEKDREQVEWELFSMDTDNLCGDIMEYANMLCPAPTTTAANTSSSATTTVVELPDDTAARSESNDLKRALFLSGISTPNDDATTCPLRRKRSLTAIDFLSLELCYHQDFDQLQREGSVRVSQGITYQGRLPGSINGCTVIAPLLCVHHFMNTNETDNNNNNNNKASIDYGLPDAVITNVIDLETPAILPEVRSNLGLAKNSLIIPQDVHDFLIDKQLLMSEQFVTVIGGNILDDDHVTGFVDNLKQSSGSRKLGATFFFHEHVIAILRLQRSEEVWYDLIDSLPNKETLVGCNEAADFEETNQNVSRIRCVNEEALMATLKWFACSRFTDENRQYIDTYDWDESYSDFDPRVFQAFIWEEMK